MSPDLLHSYNQHDSKKLFISLLFCILLITFNIVTFFAVPSFLKATYNIFFILFFPGFLLYLIFNKTLRSLSETLIFSVGYSLAFLIIGGLTINTVFFLLNYSNPLSAINLALFIDTFLLVLILLAYPRTNGFEISIPIPKIKFKHIVFTIFPLLFVALSIAGAISLNNGGSNIWIMVMLGLMALYSITSAFLVREDFDYTFPLYCMSLSLLLMLSLRSGYVTGWDIQEEFTKFAQTFAQLEWSNVLDNSPYNSCLSITILPTMIAQLTDIAPEYVFKIVFQIIFAFMPVCGYVLMQQYTEKKIAFFAGLYLIAQPFFIQPMTSLMRQEIGFIFFAMILFVLFQKHLTGIGKNITLSIMVVSMVLSHYSTSYLSIVLFTFTFIFFLIYRLLIRIEKVRNFFTKIWLFGGNSYRLTAMVSLPFLILLITSTFVWYTVINRSPDNLYTITIETLNKFKDIFDPKKNDQSANKSLNLYSKTTGNTVELIKRFIRENEKKYRSYYLNHYDPSTYSDFKIIAIQPETTRPLIKTNFNKDIIHIFELNKQLTKIFIFIGALYVLFFVFKKDYFKKEYLMVGFVSILIISIVVFHPTISARYNISRAYLQLLMVLSVFAVFGSFALTFSFPKKIQLTITALLFSMILVYHHGFIAQLLGGQAYMHLNTYGEDYDKFFVHKSELYAGMWLKKNSDPKPPLFADRESNLRLYKTHNKYAITAVFPQFIQIDSYVYARYANVVQGRTVINYARRDLLYQFPFEFLNENKNLIYSSKTSLIYK